MYKKKNKNFSAEKRRPSNKRRYSSGKKRNNNKSVDSALFVRKSSNEKEKAPYESQRRFSDFTVDSRLKSSIQRKGYQIPTEIQDKTIPLIIEGKDVIGIANTGTGKTAAFLLPLINKVLQNKKERVFIVAPTRELAFQIHEELLSLTWSLGIYSAVCTGGSNIAMQIARLQRSPHFVIGTPGRLKDLVIRKKLFLQGFCNIVLDEADRMLDMGFIDDIRFLMGKLSEKRQTLLFSATIPPAIESLIRTFLKDPIKISIKSQETPAGVDQDIVRVRGKKEKLEKLCLLLENKSEFQKVLVFSRTKRDVEKLSQELGNRGFRVASIHGDKPQSKRRQALDLFKSNRVQALIATDVAARGLDILDISHVINFDVPNTYDDYIHRIGRTGRANRKGVALTFVE